MTDVLARVGYYTAPGTYVRIQPGTPTGGGGGGGGGGATAWDPSQILVDQPRPSGAGYVRYEDLYVTGDDLQDVANRVPLSGGLRQYLTFPSGTFEFIAFNNGFYDSVRLGSGGANGCAGFIGSGLTQTLFRLRANTATRVKLEADNVTATTDGNGHAIAGTLCRIEGVPNARFSNFRLEGTSQSVTYAGTTYDCVYTGLMFGVGSNDAEASWVKLVGASRGTGNAPPWETFGINIFRAHRVTLRDLEIDGRNTAGTRFCASAFGWNGNSMTDPALDAKVYRVYAHHSLAGMPTWWQTKNITTEDLWSFSNGSGSGSLSGHGINHEQSWGHIVHTRPHLQPRSTQGTEADKTGNSGTHFSLLNTTFDPALDFTMIDPVWDKNFGSTGMLMMAGYDTYRGTTNKLSAVPKIIKNAVQLQEKEHPLSGWNSSDPTLYFARIH